MNCLLRSTLTTDQHFPFLGRYVQRRITFVSRGSVVGVVIEQEHGSPLVQNASQQLFDYNAT